MNQLVPDAAAAEAEGTVKIRIEGLRKSFGDLVVLDGIDATVTHGEVVCVIGPSGSGKSTFLRCLNKLEDISGGRVIVDDFDLTDPKVDLDEVRQHIGMVFQHFNLFPHMTVLQNVTLAPLLTEKMGKDAAEQRALELLAQVGPAVDDQEHLAEPVIRRRPRGSVALSRGAVTESLPLLPGQ